MIISHSFLTGKRMLLGFAVAAAFVSSASGQGAPASAAKTPDISGLWLVQDPGSGSWEDFWNGVPKPALTPAVIQDNKVRVAKERSGDVVNASRGGPGCPQGNIPMMMASSPPLMIVQSRDEVTIGSESNRGRFIYLDGRPHPADPATMAWSGAGHSVGHWEGDTLVVDTVDFPARVCDTRNPTILVPGGGRALPSTHLTERYRVEDNGKTLSVTFTWSDPEVYLQPHTYTYKYKNISDSLPIENNPGGGGGPAGLPQAPNTPAAPTQQTNYGRATVRPEDLPDGVVPGP